MNSIRQSLQKLVSCFTEKKMASPDTSAIKAPPGVNAEQFEAQVLESFNKINSAVQTEKAALKLAQREIRGDENPKCLFFGGFGLLFLYSEAWRGFFKAVGWVNHHFGQHLAIIAMMGGGISIFLMLFMVYKLVFLPWCRSSWRQKIFYPLIVAALFLASTVQAQMVVNDPVNLIQNTITAAQSQLSAAYNAQIAGTSAQQLVTQGQQYAKQLQQYEAQIQQLQTEASQLQNMVQNTTQLASFAMPSGISSIGNMQGVATSFSGVTGGSGGLSGYLGQLKNLSQYQQLFSGGITPGAISASSNNQTTLSAARQAAAADVLNTAQQQQNGIQADANNLGQLTSAAQSATGALQVGQANAQLLAAQNNQILQQRQAELAALKLQAAKDQADQDRGAAGDAAVQAAWQADPNITSMSTLQFQIKQ